MALLVLADRLVRPRPAHRQIPPDPADLEVPATLASPEVQLGLRDRWGQRDPAGQPTLADRVHPVAPRRLGRPAVLPVPPVPPHQSRPAVLSVLRDPLHPRRQRALLHRRVLLPQQVLLDQLDLRHPPVQPDLAAPPRQSHPADPGGLALPTVPLVRWDPEIPARPPPPVDLADRTDPLDL